MQNLEIFDYSLAQDTVGEFEVEDLDNSVYEFELTNSTSYDNDKFEISNGMLVLADDVDYSQQSSFLIEVEASDLSGCSIVKEFAIDVINTNAEPYDIFFVDDDNSINENEESGTVVGILGVLDSTQIDSHVFTLESPSDFFSISGNEVLSEVVFDYESEDTYTILVRVTDNAGNFYIEEMTINVVDVIELDDLKANNVITPNGDGYNDFFAIPNVDLFTDFEILVYNENGNQVYRRSSSAGYNNLWNGLTTDGQELPTGAYYYTLYNRNTQERFAGIINLLRN